MEANKYRTHTCGQIRESDAGQTVRLAGWVDTNRDMGGLIFIDLRDKHGIIAMGWDRVVWLLSETDTIRDVIAFPKNQKGADLMTNAPGDVSENQLMDLAIKVQT